MKRIYVLLLMSSFCLSFATLFGQNAKLDSLLKRTDISGSADIYFRTNLNGDQQTAPPTAFANLPGFALGMLNFKVSHEFKNIGAEADIVFGPRGEDATFLSPLLRPEGNSSAINQLFVYWNVSDDLTLTLGNFNTFLGYEVISPTGNFNYSTSYLFSYGPFSHSGVKVDYRFGDGFNVMAGIFNPTDATEYNPNNNYVGGFQLGYSKASLEVYLNTVLSSDFYQFDLTLGYDLKESIHLGLNASTAKNSFLGAAGYLNVATADNLSVGTRIEYFVDKGVELFALDENVFGLTISGNYSLGNLMLIPEFRFDFFSTAVVPDGSNFEKSLGSILLVGVYTF